MASLMNRILIRQWFSNKIYPLLFSFCIIISIGAYLTLDALQASIKEYVADNQKQIVGGDIILSSKRKWPETLKVKLSQLTSNNHVYDYQFNAIAYTQKDSILTRIKAVTAHYPLYGKLLVKHLHKPWKQGSVLVDQQILNQMSLKIGDSIKIGEKNFIIANEIISEPDRPLTAFGFGSRILMHESDLAKTQLLGQKSRVNYRIEIKCNQKELKPLLKHLSTLIVGTNISITTSSSSTTSISNLSLNFLGFLKLLVIAVILLSAIGVMSVMSTFIENQKKTNAIRSALGETNKSIVKSYRLVFLFFIFISVFFAWLSSLLVLHFGKELFTALLPAGVNLTVPLISLLKALIISIAIGFFVSEHSFRKLRNIKPIAVFSNRSGFSVKSSSKIWLLSGVVSLLVLLYSELNSIKQSIVFLLGVSFIWILFKLLTQVFLGFLEYLVRKKIIKHWILIISIQNIFRKGNQSSLFITAISLTITVLACITLLDNSLQQQFVTTYPKDAPNFFLLDIQTNQQTKLNALLKQKLTYYPVIRARIESVNGIKSSVLKDQLSRYDNITRIFNLSYSDELMKTEFIQSSINKTLFFDFKDYKPVSILSSFADYLNVELGDVIVFNVQGIKISGKISSIRKRNKKGLSPFFYFLFPPSVMQDAPQIRFATAKVKESQRNILQTQIAKNFPGITTLDGGAIAKKLKSFVDQLLPHVQLFTFLSLITGGLIFATSLLATSQDRLRESFYYKMMGMTSNDLNKLTLIEFTSMGLFAFYLGLSTAILISYLICNYWLSLNLIIPWRLFITSSGLLITLLIFTSFYYNKYVNKVKVMHFLRHEE